MQNETFETKLKKLQTISEKLKDENISLDNAISLYEDGMKLYNNLSEELKKMEEKINIVKDSGEVDLNDDNE